MGTNWSLRLAAGASILLCTWTAARAAGPGVQQGIVRYEPAKEEAKVPEQFRLPRHTFPFQQRPLGKVSDKLSIRMVTFPSPVNSPHESNNTVHCEYYRPQQAGKVPAVLVLHILGGDFELARLFCNALAHRGVAALFLKMPYYGPRREKGVSRRMISKDPRETVEGMRQAVLDIRRAAAWLRSREEVDENRLGIFGISLGGITAALASTAEPRLSNICLLLAGGDVSRIVWDSPELDGVRRYWIEQGGTQKSFFKLLKTIDPVTYAANVQDRRILMLNAAQDEVIPKSCTQSLWKAFGEPPIIWYEGGHYSVARHLLDTLNRVTRFFQEEMAEK